MSDYRSGNNEFQVVGKKNRVVASFKKVGSTENKKVVSNLKPFQRRDEKVKQDDRPKKEVDPSKPFCKVCKDAGKSEEEYSNHFVRESSAPDSLVVCPTLLGQMCRYCRKQGHTVRYCPSLTSRLSDEQKVKIKKFSPFIKKNQSSFSKDKNQNEINKNESSYNDLTTKQIMSNNPFGALHDDDDDENTNQSQSDAVAKNDWDALSQGKTLNYGDLKVKCVDGKLVFEVIKPSDAVPRNEQKTWAHIAASKSS